MRLLHILLAAIVGLALIAASIGPISPAAATDGASVSASAKAKKKCKKLKGAKKRKCLKNAARPGKNGKPWAGSPYKPGITCAMSPEMQRKYAKYGLTCIDLGLGVTTLVEL